MVVSVVHRSAVLSRGCRSRGLMTTSNSKAYSKTLLLPKTVFPQWFDPTKSEVPYRKKMSDGLYKWQGENAKGPLFVLHDGPPYANGSLHMGHALNKILKDIINRYHVLRGRRVNYIPGWDCHGLPIENKALKELGQDAHNLPTDTIRTAAKAVAEREIQTQKEEFTQLGIMADWSRNGTYRTIDKSYELRQLRVFQRMVEKGYIYRDFRPVYYSPSSRSALAEAELVYADDHESCSVFAVFKLRDCGKDAGLGAMSERLRNLLEERHSEGKDVEVIVWTTTPWTLTANMGIAVHPEIVYSALRKFDGRITIVAKDRVQELYQQVGPGEEVMYFSGSELINASYTPLFPSTSPSIAPFKIIASSHVTADSGTGFVHCAPAHGAEDYVAFKTLGLLRPHSQLPDSNAVRGSFPIVCHVDWEGKFDASIVDVVGDEVGKRLVGLEVLDKGAREVRDILLGTGGVVATKNIKHRYPYDWKTGKPVVVRATEQWFANLDRIKEGALQALEGVQFVPPSSRARLTAFVQSRSEWCISRQRVWGVPIPSLHHIPSGRAVLDSLSLTHILSVLEEKGVGYWWDGPIEEFVPPHLRDGEGGDLAKVWRKGTDTMDVWFDSGSSWALLKERGIKSDGDGSVARQAFSDVCLEGSDQHRGWFQSLLLTSVAAQNGEEGELPILPYRTLITHGMVLDESGRKMSKSEGNVVSPMMIVNGGKDKSKDPAYGADTLRLWTASVEPWRDMPLSSRSLSQSAEALRKLRNTARFILGNVGNMERRKARGIVKVGKEDMGLVDRYVMHELCKLEAIVIEAYEAYNFPRVVSSLSNFANVTLSALYFDMTKDCLYADCEDSKPRRAVLAVLEQTLETLTSILAPIAPHLAEEIHYYEQGGERAKGDGLSVFTRPWKTLGVEWFDPQVDSDMQSLLYVRDGVLSMLEKARMDKKIRSSLEAEVDLLVPSGLEDNNLIQLLNQEEDLFKTLFIVSDANLTDEGDLGTGDCEWIFTGSVDIPGNDVESLGIRVRPATLPKCPRCWTYTRPQNHDLCDRCAKTVSTLQS